MRRAGDQTLEQGWNAVQEVYIVATEIVPELERRRAERVTDDDGRAAMRQRQCDLLDRTIKGSRAHERHAEARPCSELFAQRDDLVRKACVIDHDAFWRTC